MSFQRWSNANPEKVYRLQPFGAVMSDFREVGGYRLPFRVEAGNMFGTDELFPVLPCGRHRHPVSGGAAMTALVLAVQVALPLALIAWLVFLPEGSLAGFVLQAAGTGAFLFALARIAQWAVPVWWLPWVYGGLWLVVVLPGCCVGARTACRCFPARHGDGRGLRCLDPAGPRRVVRRAGAGGACAAAGRGRGHRQPLRPGAVPCGDGGSNPLVNAHMRTLDPASSASGHGAGNPTRSISSVWASGAPASGWQPADPAAYAIFGAELSALRRNVVAAEGGMPDFEVPKEDPVNGLATT